MASLVLEVSNLEAYHCLVFFRYNWNNLNTISFLLEVSLNRTIRWWDWETSQWIRWMKLSTSLSFVNIRVFLHGLKVVWSNWKCFLTDNDCFEKKVLLKTFLGRGVVVKLIWFGYKFWLWNTATLLFQPMRLNCNFFDKEKNYGGLLKALFGSLVSSCWHMILIYFWVCDRKTLCKNSNFFHLLVLIDTWYKSTDGKLNAK